MVINYLGIKWREPDIKIKDGVIVRGFHLTDNAQQVLYHANRIVIKNECKTQQKVAKLISNLVTMTLKRTGWMLPDKNAGYTVTLNVDDKEYLDLCAIDDNGMNLVVTMERGYTLTPKSEKIIHMILRISKE